MVTLGRLYGLSPMSLEQELNAPAPVKQTRNSKVAIIDVCCELKRFAEQTMSYARRIPEENDEKHSALVRAYADGMRAAMNLLWENEGMKYSDAECIATETKGRG